jgi:predicted phosphoadenosine phosphosulfate sulfurtransferase
LIIVPDSADPSESLRLLGGATRTSAAAVTKLPLGISVLAAARQRIAWVFDTFPRIYLSFSGGKDSSVMFHLVMEEAKRRRDAGETRRRVGVLFVDLEAQYRLTIDHVRECMEMYADLIEPFWVALPLHLRNAVSAFEPHWLCWEPGREADWVRQPEPGSITDEGFFPFFRRGMEFEEFVPKFGEWYGQGKLCACLVGIRTDESLNRWRSLAGGRRGKAKATLEGKKWTTWVGDGGGFLYNVYPVYDWRVEDIWTYHGKTALPHNRLYDRMHQAGLTLSQMRICQPYGDDQRRGLWLFHLIEPETWARIVARVAGANGGALYVQERGNVMGYDKISLPDGHTWESFAHLLLDTMPPATAEHFRNKIAVFIRWWTVRGFENGIPQEADPKLEADRKAPSWRRICKVLLRYDYWCKGLTFTQHKSESFERYKKIMKNRRQRWGLF